MKVTVQLQPGSIGITFQGMPAVVKCISETSLYGHLVQPHMVVTGVQIVNVMEITGDSTTGSALVDLLKKHSESVHRRYLNLEDHPLVDVKDRASTELTGVFNLHYQHHEYALQRNGCRDALLGCTCNMRIPLFCNNCIGGGGGVFGHRSDDFCPNKFFEWWKREQTMTNSFLDSG